MLTLAFLAEALDEIDNDILSATMLEQLEAWLARRRS
jgi:Fe-S cluster assembly protein SufD